MGAEAMQEMPEDEWAIGFLPADVPILLGRFLEFWSAARRDRPVPDFVDLDPLGMPWALRTIFVVERHDDGRMTYRLVGTSMSDRLGGKLVGKTANDVFEADYADRVNARWNRVLDEPALCYAVTRHLTRAGRILQARRLLAPARTGSGRIDRVVGVSAFDQGHFEAGSGIDGGVEIDVRWLGLTASKPRLLRK
jgi:hypothetical protein